MTKRHITDRQHLLTDMARAGTADRQETSLIVSSGDRTGTWAVKVKSRVNYNVYKVRRIVIEDAGLPPTEFGEEIEATNLAESFLSQGTLAAGTCAVMSHVGEKHIFHAKP